MKPRTHDQIFPDLGDGPRPGVCCIPSKQRLASLNASRVDSANRRRATGGSLENMIRLEGAFRMGSETPDAFPADGEGPVRQVTLSPFYISKFAVTAEEQRRKDLEFRVPIPRDATESRACGLWRRCDTQSSAHRSSGHAHFLLRAAGEQEENGPRSPARRPAKELAGTACRPSDTQSCAHRSCATQDPTARRPAFQVGEVLRWHATWRYAILCASALGNTQDRRSATGRSKANACLSSAGPPLLQRWPGPVPGKRSS